MEMATLLQYDAHITNYRVMYTSVDILIDCGNHVLHGFIDWLDDKPLYNNNTDMFIGLIY